MASSRPQSEMWSGTSTVVSGMALSGVCGLVWGGCRGTGCSDGAEETGVKATEDFKDVLIHVAAVLLVVCCSPWDVRELYAECL